VTPTEAFDFSSPDYSAVFAERFRRLQWLRKNQQSIPALKKHYRDNVGQFTCDWGCTYDPRNIERGLPAEIPFILFPRQREWMQWVVERWKGSEDGLTEKSRDMGVTWLSVALAAELWLFNPGIAIGFGSRKAELVDRLGDMDSIFEKIRMYLRLIPPEFLPYGMPPKESRKRRYVEAKDASHMKIFNIETLSSITGEAGDNIGRGGRKSIYFKDESAFYERPQKIDAALSQTSRCKMDISTPNGVGNPFWSKRFGGKIPVFTFHWKEDPRKDEAWYQRQKDTLDPVTVAQEIDIDYAASIDGVCIPGPWVQAAVNLHEKLGLVPSGRRRCGLDVADEEGSDANAIAEIIGTTVLEIDSWNGIDTHQTACRADAFASSKRAEYVNYDSIGPGAGVRGSSKSLPTTFYAVAVSESPRRGHVIDNSDKLNRDHYLNLRAQLWWEMRIRCQRAYQHLEGIKYYSLDEMVSLPNHPGLISQLSQPLFGYTDAGKIVIESKDAMKTRGVKSPNEAEAVLLGFAQPKREPMSFVQTEFVPGVID
jgi:phage terminase large subunit